MSSLIFPFFFLLDHMIMIWQFSNIDNAILLNAILLKMLVSKHRMQHLSNILCFQLLWCSTQTLLTLNLYCLKI